MSRRTGLLASAIVFSLVASAAWVAVMASHLPATDNDDTRGPLDVRRVEVFGTKKPLWKVVTYPRWGTAQIYDTGYATIFLDTFDGPRPDYYILVGSKGTGLYGHLFRDRENKRDVNLGSLKRIGRGDRRSFYVRLPLWRMKVGDRRAFFRWRVETLFTGDECRRVCFDLVPDDGLVTEPLPVETPTASPTPTPSPTE